MIDNKLAFLCDDRRKRLERIECARRRGGGRSVAPGKRESAAALGPMRGPVFETRRGKAWRMLPGGGADCLGCQIVLFGK